MSGTSVRATHFIAMLAFDPGVPSGDGPPLTLVSLALPVLVGWAAFVARRSLPGLPGQATAAGLPILGVVALHCLGMAAILVLPDPAATPEAGLVAPALLAAAAGVGTLLIPCAGLAAATQAIRFRRRDREEAERQRSPADATIEGLLVCDGDRIVTSNHSIRALLGRPEAWFQGRPVSEAIPDLPGTHPPRAEVTLPYPFSLRADG